MKSRFLHQLNLIARPQRFYNFQHKTLHQVIQELVNSKLDLNQLNLHYVETSKLASKHKDYIGFYLLVLHKDYLFEKYVHHIYQ